MSEWINQIPAGWADLPLKRWVGIQITDGPHESPDLVDEGVPFVSAEAIQKGRIVFEKQRGFITREAHIEYSRKTKPQRNDILMCKSGATTGKIGIVETDDEFSIWSPLALIRAHYRKADPRFLFYALSSAYVQNQIQTRWSIGTQPNIGMGVIESLSIIAPSQDEQRVIADFLDREIIRIDQIAAKRRRLSCLIIKERDAEIAGLVVGSGWQEMQLRHTFSGPFVNGVFKKNEDFGSGIKLVNVFDAYRDNFTVDTKTLESVQIDASELKRYALKDGDILFVRSSLKREGIGRAVLVPVSSEALVFECHLVRGRTNARIAEPEFLAYLLNSVPVRQALIARANTTTMTTIDQSGLSSLPIRLPSLSEQKRRAAKIRELLKRSATLQSCFEEYQLKLYEYRSALVSAAITGQIDVRTYRPQEAAVLCQ